MSGAVGLLVALALAAAPVDIRDLQVQPASIHLRGADESTQFIVTGVLNENGRLQDLTGDVEYSVSDRGIVRVTSTGRILPIASGQTTITARYGDKAISVPVKTQWIEANLPINFPNQIVPIFSKAGCNSGGCHGKSGGQNGFALSLFGFVPELDYQSLVNDSRGRRLFPANPDLSLLLKKATGQMPHAGGKRMEVDSEEYKLVRRWLAAGTPFGRSEDPVLVKITVTPEHRILPRNGRQQLAVLAHYSDGETVDVTQRALYESNDPEVAVFTEDGVINSLAMPGEAAVMVRYQSEVATFRATVPLGLKIPDYQFARQTVVDEFTHKKWQELGIVPSELCSDETFIRRVTLDLTGTMPTPEEVLAFAADTDPKRRDKLIDRLLETEEYSYYFANRWCDVLRVRRGNNPQMARAGGTFAFHRWIRESLAQDKPYDQFVREIIGAMGDENSFPPTVWFKDLQKPEQFVDDACQVFLGMRLQCAQCHHHPYERWSQDDYWGMAAFFGHVARKQVPIPSLVVANQPQVKMVIFNRPNTVINIRTKKAALMKLLDGEHVTLETGDDPRQRLIDWMVEPQNPFFARALANRYWAHFGRGLVDPLDDMRITNPPSNPELLDALAKAVVDSKYSIKQLVRTIVGSRTYQLSVTANEFNKHDKRSFARFYPRRMQAEVLYDAVSHVTGTAASFPGMPVDRHAPNRAIMLPDESYPSYFLDVFSRPQRISACECERINEANVAQALHLLNSKEVHDKLTRSGARADLLARDNRIDADKVDELFLRALGRRPSMNQSLFAQDRIRARGADKKSAYEDIIWALINSKEFILIQ